MHGESFEAFVARVNSSAFLAPPTPSSGGHPPKAKKEKKKMAKQLKSEGKGAFTFRPVSRIGGGTSKYNWDQYLDQGIWQLEVGDDIALADTKTKDIEDSSEVKLDKTLNQFATRAKFVANMRGQEIRTQKTDNGIVIQAQGPPDAVKGQAFKDHQKTLIAERAAKKAAGTVAETSDEHEMQE